MGSSWYEVVQADEPLDPGDLTVIFPILEFF